MPNPPSLQDTALEHLRVIRTLMERAHIYRAVSAPAALIGGVLSLAVAAYGYHFNHDVAESSFKGWDFLLAWYGVLIATSIVNFLLLFREAGLKGERPFSEGMRMALRGLTPPMLTGGILGSCLIGTDHDAAIGALVWILCYGLALQATVSFAPQSIIRLARAFLITGQVFVLWYFVEGHFQIGVFRRYHQGDALPFSSQTMASLFLGITFGLFHIIYAIGVFVSKPQTSESRAERFIESP